MLDNQITDNQQEEILARIDNLKSLLPEDIIINAGINLEGLDSDFGEFLTECQNIINAAGMTADQARQYFESMGFEAEFEKHEEPVEQTSPITVRETRVRGYNTGIAKGPMGIPIPWSYPILEEATYQDGSRTFTGMQTVMAMSTNGKTPVIKSLTKKGTGSMNNYSSKNIGGGSPGKSSKSGGGGGSPKDPNTIDPLKEEADRYHKINTQITKVDNSLKKLQSQEEKFAGAKLIDNLNQQ